MATKRTAPIQTLANADEDGNAMKLTTEKGRSTGFLTARMHIDAAARHAVVGIMATGEFFGGEAGKAGAGDHVEALTDAIAKVAAGDLSVASRTMTAQALSLDALFTQLVRRASLNLGSFPDAADRYMRLAFKAQAQSRSTFEALIGLHQPREQVVRHVHVTRAAKPSSPTSFIITRRGAEMPETTNKPVQPEPSVLAEAPRCHARTRSGAACRSPAVRGKKRCRMHGGAAGSGAPKGNSNAMRHGARSAAFLAMVKALRNGV